MQKDFFNSIGHKQPPDQPRYGPFFQLRTLAAASDPLVRPSNPA